MDFAAIRLLVLDVDGVLTDGRLSAAGDDEMGVNFHVRDGMAVQLWQRAGGKVAILSGRANPAVTARARELGIACIHTGVKDKWRGYDRVLSETGCDDRATAYVGDDVPDLKPMSRCALPIAVADAAPAVKRAAYLLTRRNGGGGAAAEVIEFLLRKQAKWSQAVRRDG